MTPFLTKQELEKKRKAKESVSPKIKQETGENREAFMERLLNKPVDVKAVEVPKQKKFTGVPEVSVGDVAEKKIKEQEKEIEINENILFLQNLINEFNVLKEETLKATDFKVAELYKEKVMDK